MKILALTIMACMSSTVFSMQEMRDITNRVNNVINDRGQMIFELNEFSKEISNTIAREEKKKARFNAFQKKAIRAELNNENNVDYNMAPGFENINLN